MQIKNRAIFWAFAIAILIAYTIVLWLAYSRSNFLGTVIIAAFPLILLYVVLLLRVNPEKREKKQSVPIYNKPDI